MADDSENCGQLKKESKENALTIENLQKEVQNLNVRIDIMGINQDEKCEKIIDNLKLFFDDLLITFKNKDKPKNQPKEEELPIMERINKSFIEILQLKPAVMLKYGYKLLEKVWEINDELNNNYSLPEELLSQSFNKRLTPLEIMKYFLQLLFGGATKIDELLEQKYIIFDEKKRKVTTNEEKIKEIWEIPEKYSNENNYNLLSNLILLKIFTYTKAEIFCNKLDKILLSLDNNVIRFYKVLSLYAFCLWNLNNKKEDLIRSLSYNIFGIIKNFSKSLLTTEKIDVDKLTFFKDKENDFKAITLPEKSVLLLKKFLLVTLVNFISMFITGYDANKPYDIQDGNYWDEYYGFILRLKDPKLTGDEMKEISRMIPLSLDTKNSILLFITDLLFLFVTHFSYVKDNKLVSDFEGFDCLKQFAEYMILNSNYNILTFFQKNFNHRRFEQCVSETKEYQKKDNFNTYGLFFVLFSLLQHKKIPLLINKAAYVEIMTVYLRVVLYETKDYVLPNNNKDELNKYYINEMKKNKMIDLEDDVLKNFI